VFFHRRFGAVNLEGVIVKGETAAVVRFAGVFGGEQGVKIKVLGDRRKRFPPDKPASGGSAG
jgi:hypothetical protein